MALYNDLGNVLGGFPDIATAAPLLEVFWQRYRKIITTWRCHAGLRIARDMWEFMPTLHTLCDLGAPGWGKPWFPRGAVLLFLTSPVWRSFLVLLLISRHSDDAKPCCFLVLFCLSFCLFVLFCFVCFGFALFLFIQHGDGLPGLQTGPSSARSLVPKLLTKMGNATINANMLHANIACGLTWRKPRGEGRKKKWTLPSL